MTPEAFRKAALSLPEAHEVPHFQRTSFRVGKKIFATMTPDGQEAMVTPASVERLQTLLTEQSDVFFSYGGWTERNGSMGVRLAKADEKLIVQLLLESWARIAPKRALAALQRL